MRRPCAWNPPYYLPAGILTTSTGMSYKKGSSDTSTYCLKIRALITNRSTQHPARRGIDEVKYWYQYRYLLELIILRYSSSRGQVAGRTVLKRIINYLTRINNRSGIERSLRLVAMTSRGQSELYASMLSRGVASELARTCAV